MSDSTSISSVAPSLEPPPNFPPTESPPPGYMSEDGDSHDIHDITDYSGKEINIRSGPCSSHFLFSLIISYGQNYFFTFVKLEV